MNSDGIGRSHFISLWPYALTQYSIFVFFFVVNVLVFPRMSRACTPVEWFHIINRSHGISFRPIAIIRRATHVCVCAYRCNHLVVALEIIKSEIVNTLPAWNRDVREPAATASSAPRTTLDATIQSAMHAAAGATFSFLSSIDWLHMHTWFVVT